MKLMPINRYNKIKAARNENSYRKRNARSHSRE